MTFPKVEFSEDERRTRYATFLLSMSSVAKRFPSFQREAVATILAPLKIFQVPMNRLKLVFENMAAGGRFGRRLSGADAAVRPGDNVKKPYLPQSRY